MQIWKQSISDVNCEDSKEELGMFEIHQESPMAGI